MLRRLLRHRRQVAAPLLAVFALVWAIAVVTPCLVTMPCHATESGDAPPSSRTDCPTIAALDCQLSYQQVASSPDRSPGDAFAETAPTVIALLPPPVAILSPGAWPPRLAAAAVVRRQPASPHFVLRL